MTQFKTISAVLKAFPALSGGKTIHIVSCTNEDEESLQKNLNHIKHGETGHWNVAKKREIPIRKGDVVVVVMSPVGKKYPKEIYCGTMRADIEGKTKERFVFPVNYVNKKKPVAQVDISPGIKNFLLGASCPEGNNVNSIFGAGISVAQPAANKKSDGWTSAELSKLLVDAGNCKDGEFDAVKEILANTSIHSTEKIQLVLARVGQGKFRKNVLARAKCCDVTGFEDASLLLASHILPWAKCKTDAQRLDANNGLLLSPNLDRLFDRGLITFDGNGAMLALGENLAALTQLVPSAFEGQDKLRKKPNSKQQEYLKMHMEIYNLQKALRVSEIPRRKSRSRPRPLRVNE